MIALMDRAEKERSWECLKPYPALLFWWQTSHKADLMDIAYWVSHFRMPFMKPDYQKRFFSIPQGKNQPNKDCFYEMGKQTYGHAMCKQNCEKNDYRTGALIAPQLL